MILQAILVALIATCCSWWFSHTITRTWLYPIFSGFLVGIVMGQPVEGAMIAAAINLPYVGFITAGGTMPGNPQFAGPVGTALALTSGMDVATATSIGVILGSAGVLLWNIYMSLNAIWVHMAEKQLEKGNYYAVRFFNYVPSFFVSLVLNGIPAFLVVTQGQAFGDVLTHMPQWLMDIFSIAGGILPALGVAMLLSFLGKGKLFAFFFVGFFITLYFQVPVLDSDGNLEKFTNFPTMGVAILGTLVAIIMYQFSKENEGAPSILESFKQAKEETEELPPDAPRLKKRDLVKTWFLGYSSECCYNYERLQAMGNANAFLPIICRLYPKEKRTEEIKKYMNFFNTEPSYMGPVIHGVTAAMEETRAQTGEISSDNIVSLRSSLMGPIAGIGDTISQSIIYPILAGICIQLALGGNIAGPIIFEVVYKALMLTIGYNMFMLGYKQGRSAILNFLRTGLLDRIMEAVSIVGLMVIGNMAANNVKFTMNVNISFSNDLGAVPLNLQTGVFDALLPGLLPLALVMGAYFMLKKRCKPTTIILVSFGIAIIYTAVVMLAGGYGTWAELTSTMFGFAAAAA